MDKPLPFMKQEISGLRSYCQYTTVDILAAIADVMREFPKIFLLTAKLGN